MASDQLTQTHKTKKIFSTERTSQMRHRTTNQQAKKGNCTLLRSVAAVTFSGFNVGRIPTPTKILSRPYSATLLNYGLESYLREEKAEEKARFCFFDERKKWWRKILCLLFFEMGQEHCKYWRFGWCMRGISYCSKK